MTGEEEKLDLPKLSEGQSLEALISAPLVAVSKANAVMLCGQTEFLLNYCFIKKKDIYSPVFIKMEYTLSNDEGNQKWFYIPLLTLLPINHLAVDKLKINFNLEVTNTITHVSKALGLSKKGRDTAPAKQNILMKKSKLGARIGNRNEEENKSGIEVSIKAKEIPLSKGVTALINAYSKNIINGD